MSAEAGDTRAPKTISEKVRPVIKQLGRNLVAQRAITDGLENENEVVLDTALSVAGSVLLGFSVLEDLDDHLQQRLLFASTLAGYTPAVTKAFYDRYLDRELHDYLQKLLEGKPS